MGFEFEYSINGRKVSKDQWLRSMTEEAKTATIEELKANVARLRCGVHGKSPRVVGTTKSGDRVQFEIVACCDQMLERAQQVAIGR